MVNQFFISGPRNLPRYPLDCITLDSWVCDDLVLADKLFAKALWRLKTCLTVSNILCGKLALSQELRIIFDDNLRVMLVCSWIQFFKLWKRWFHIYIVILCHFVLTLYQTKINS